MPKVLIYTTGLCPYCWTAKRLFAEKDVSYQEVDILETPEARADMVAKSGGRTSVPQIFIGDIHIGGSDDLYALEEQGCLDSLLGLE